MFLDVAIILALDCFVQCTQDGPTHRGIVSLVWVQCLLMTEIASPSHMVTKQTCVPDIRGADRLPSQGCLDGRAGGDRWSWAFPLLPTPAAQPLGTTKVTQDMSGGPGLALWPLSSSCRSASIRLPWLPAWTDSSLSAESSHPSVTMTKRSFPGHFQIDRFLWYLKCS